MKKSLIALLSILFLAAVIVGAADARGVNREADEGTKRSCRYGSEITKKAFVGTEFENFDFYKSCLENIYNANPLQRRYYAE